MIDSYSLRSGCGAGIGCCLAHVRSAARLQVSRLNPAPNPAQCTYHDGLHLGLVNAERQRVPEAGGQLANVVRHARRRTTRTARRGPSLLRVEVRTRVVRLAELGKALRHLGGRLRVWSRLVRRYQVSRIFTHACDVPGGLLRSGNWISGLWTRAARASVVLSMAVIRTFARAHEAGRR